MKTRSGVKRAPQQSTEPENTAVPKKQKVKTKKKSAVSSPVVEKTISVCKTDASSDSSSDEFTKASEIDFNSEYLKVKQKDDFSAIESNIFSGVSRLSDSDDSDFEDVTENISLKNESSQIDPVRIGFKENESKKKMKCRKYKPSSESRKSSGSNKKNKSDYNDTLPVKPEEDNFEEINDLDVSQLLALGEGPSNLQSVKEYEGFNSYDEQSDWEEVTEKNVKPIIPKDGVQITLEGPALYTGRKKKEFDIEGHIKRRINRVKREVQVFIHKVHLLCYIAHGMFLNSVLNDTRLLGVGLSLLPSDKCYPPKYAGLSYLENVANWFRDLILLKPGPYLKSFDVPLLESLEKQFETKAAKSIENMVLMFLCVMRSLGMKARLVLSLQPLPLKPPHDQLCTFSKKSDSSPNKNELSNSNKTTSPQKQKSVTTRKDNQKSNNKIGKDKVGAKAKQHSDEGCSKSEKCSKCVSEKKTSKQDTEVEKAIKGKICNDKNVSESERNTINVTKREVSRKSVTKTKKVIKKDIEPEDDVSEYKTGNKKIAQNKTEKKSVARAKETRKEKNKLEQIDDVQPNYNSHSSSSGGKENKNTPAMKLKKGKIDAKNSLASCSSRSLRVRKDMATKYKEADSSDTEEKEISTETPGSSTKVKSNTVKNQIVSEKKLNLAPKFCNIKNKSKPNEKKIQKDKSSMANDSSDSDFEPKVIVKKDNNKGRPRSDVSSEFDSDFERPKKRTSRKSSDVKEKKSPKKRDGCDIWVEVFLEEEEKWITVDVQKGKVHCISQICTNATLPITYVLAFQNDLTVKDVTRRYCPNFHTTTRKQRVDAEWWRETLWPYLTAGTAADKEEDEDMERQLHDRPLPTSLSEFKNHPLYVLKEHLLKFQSIYPPNAPPLGYVRGKPVYARECVKTLHSRETWVKEAKVVRIGEQPYKIVKARPKYDRLSGKVITDLPLELFGEWQVDDYIPAPVVDGKIPRNAYGNVDLFKPCMLPKGTVHLQINGLNKVAKKLGIDCAPAVTGFDFHGGWSHPVIDGYIVCEEFQDTLLDAWNQEQDESERRQREKRESRVYGNWRRLIKGLLIRERLKKKYSFSSVPGTSSCKSKLSVKKRKIVSSDEESD